MINWFCYFDRLTNGCQAGCAGLVAPAAASAIWRWPDEEFAIRPAAQLAVSLCALSSIAGRAYPYRAGQANNA